jgi:hypothetical protein
MTKFDNWFREMLVDVNNYELKPVDESKQQSYVNINEAYESNKDKWFQDCFTAVKKLEDEKNAKFITEQNIRNIYEYISISPNKDYTKALRRIISDQECINIIADTYNKLQNLTQNYPVLKRHSVDMINNIITEYDLVRKSNNPDYKGFYDKESDEPDNKDAIVDDVMNSILQEKLMTNKSKMGKSGSILFDISDQKSFTEPEDNIIKSIPSDISGQESDIEPITGRSVPATMHTVMKERKNRLAERKDVYTDLKSQLFEKIDKYDTEKISTDKEYKSINELNELDNRDEAVFDKERELVRIRMENKAKDDYAKSISNDNNIKLAKVAKESELSFLDIHSLFRN